MTTSFCWKGPDWKKSIKSSRGGKTGSRSGEGREGNSANPIRPNDGMSGAGARVGSNYWGPPSDLGCDVRIRSSPQLLLFRTCRNSRFNVPAVRSLSPPFTALLTPHPIVRAVRLLRPRRIRIPLSLIGNRRCWLIPGLAGTQMRRKFQTIFPFTVQ